MQAFWPDAQTDYRHYTDEQLLLLVSQRDPYAYEIFYDRHAQIVYNLLLHIVHEHEVAELLLQNIFLQLWQETDSWLNVGAVPVCLYRKARGQALKLIRQPQASGAQNRSARIAHAIIGQLGEQTWQSQQVESILQQMSPEQRQCVELAYFAGMRQSEIALSINLSLDTIKSHLRSGIETLEACLGASDMQKTGRRHGAATRPMASG